MVVSENIMFFQCFHKNINKDTCYFKSDQMSPFQKGLVSIVYRKHSLACREESHPPLTGLLSAPCITRYPGVCCLATRRQAGLCLSPSLECQLSEDRDLCLEQCPIAFLIGV